MILSVIGSILLSKEVYNKWQKSPVIVSFSEKYTRVSEIPFPGVTICPETKARATLLNFTDIHDRWLNIGVKEMEFRENENERLVISVSDLLVFDRNGELIKFIATFLINKVSP